MLTASSLIRKCRQTPSARGQLPPSRDADLQARDTRPAPRACPDLGPVRRSLGGHTLYDQLMRSHDRVRSRRLPT